jgi:hypothetical protein
VWPDHDTIIIGKYVVAIANDDATDDGTAANVSRIGLD